MRDAGVEKAVLVGHSMGTPVALTFLKRYPAKASGLVIVDGFIPRPPKDAADREKRTAQSVQMTQAYRAPDYKMAFHQMLDFMFTPQTPAALREEIQGKMLAALQYVLASAMEGMMALEPPVNTRFEVPAMAVMVKRPSPSSYEEYLRSLFPNLSVYQEWEGAGHFFMMEQPEKFNAALEGFLRK